MKRPLTGVLVGGCAAGALDIVYAMILTGQRARPPLRAVQSVASGLLGKAAYDMGAASVLLGFACHFTIALGAAFVYFGASRRLALLRERPLVAGSLFGMCVFLFMHFVVVPLSAAPFTMGHTPTVFAQGFLSHAVLIGIPIAAALRRFEGAR